MTYDTYFKNDLFYNQIFETKHKIILYVKVKNNVRKSFYFDIHKHFSIQFYINQL